MSKEGETKEEEKKKEEDKEKQERSKLSQQTYAIPKTSDSNTVSTE